ncbi:hypothetical protein FISHEDRAFT_78188 [Fistulina hepatica ATCC 64428]|nr:hypothetical protein FISHEDRAFT_78188 [Fistulina hepatica ATCC 64428]
MSQASTSPSSDDRIPLPARPYLNFAGRKSKFFRCVVYCVVGIRDDLKRKSKDDHSGTIDLVDVTPTNLSTRAYIIFVRHLEKDALLVTSSVDLYVIKKRTVSYTMTTTRDSQFVAEIGERDGGSIFDVLPLDRSISSRMLGETIAFNKSSRINIRSVDDVRNGFMGNPSPANAHDHRRIIGKNSKFP